MQSPRRDAGRPTTNRPIAKATDKPQSRTAPYPVDDFGVCDIFAEERRRLAESKLLRAAELASLGLTAPESSDIDALRRDLGFRHVGRPA
jgi:hypothetical protein